MKTITASGNSVSNASVNERLAFLRKVYNLLMLSVLSGAAACYMTVTSPGFLKTIANNMILFIVFYIGSLFFVMFARKRENLALVALFTFTILSGVMMSFPVIMYSEHVFNAAVLSLLVFVGLSFYAVTTKKDFSFLGGFLFVGLIVLFGGGLLNAFWLKSAGLEFFMNIGGILIFSGLILYDTSRIMNQYSSNEYVMATLSLYLDLMNLFLYILRFLGGNKD